MLLLLLHLSFILAETLSPVLSSEQTRWQGVSTPRHLLVNVEARAAQSLKLIASSLQGEVRPESRGRVAGYRDESEC